MFSRGPRWTLLTVLAIANVVLWVAIAVVLGFAATDKLDLGLETLARHSQATVVAAWESLAPAGAGREASTPVWAASLPRPETGVWAPAVLADRPAPTAPAVASSPAATRPNAPASVSRPSPAVGAGKPAAGPGPASVTQPSPTAGAPEPPASPTLPPPPAESANPSELVSEPLLVADPEIHTAQDLDAEMERSSPGRAVQIRYQEETLNQEIALLWQNNPDLPFREVVLDLKHEGVVIRGRATILGYEVKALVKGAVLVRDCVPHLQIESLSVAGVMTPGFVRDQVEKMVLEAVAWYPADYPLCLEQIVLEETRATLYGYHR